MICDFNQFQCRNSRQSLSFQIDRLFPFLSHLLLLLPNLFLLSHHIVLRLLLRLFLPSLLLPKLLFLGRVFFEGTNN